MVQLRIGPPRSEMEGGATGIVVDLREEWGEARGAYMGILAPKLPNLFFLYGPGTSLAHGGSLLFHGEWQMRWIAGCVKAILEQDASKVEPTETAYAEYMERLEKEIAGARAGGPPRSPGAFAPPSSGVDAELRARCRLLAGV